MLSGTMMVLHVPAGIVQIVIRVARTAGMRMRKAVVSFIVLCIEVETGS